MGDWSVFAQAMLAIIVVTFCILVVQSFVQSGRHQQAKDKLEQTKAEIELAVWQQKGPRNGQQ